VTHCIPELREGKKERKTEKKKRKLEGRREGGRIEEGNMEKGKKNGGRDGGYSPRLTHNGYDSPKNLKGRETLASAHSTCPAALAASSPTRGTEPGPSTRGTRT
jgi:hypothetical protein